MFQHVTKVDIRSFTVEVIFFKQVLFVYNYFCLLKIVLVLREKIYDDFQ